MSAGSSPSLRSSLPSAGPSHSLPWHRSFPHYIAFDRPDNLLPLDLTQLLEFKEGRRCQASLG